MPKVDFSADRSASSRMERLRNQTLDKVKVSYPKSGHVKNEREKNSRVDALARVRGGGYVARGAKVPPYILKGSNV